MRRSSLFLMLIIAIAATFLLSGCGQTSCVNKQDCQKAEKLICQGGDIYKQTFKGDCVTGVCSFSSNTTTLDTDCAGTCVEGLGGAPRCDDGVVYCGVACTITLQQGVPQVYVIGEKSIEFELVSSTEGVDAIINVEGNPLPAAMGQSSISDGVNYTVSTIGASSAIIDVVDTAAITPCEDGCEDTVAAGDTDYYSIVGAIHDVAPTVSGSDASFTVKGEATPVLMPGDAHELATGAWISLTSASGSDASFKLTPPCTETDLGKVEPVVGSTTGVDPATGVVTTKADACVGDQLKEYYCDGIYVREEVIDCGCDSNVCNAGSNLIVVSNVEGAIVFVDGIAEGVIVESLAQLNLPPGPREIIVGAPGYHIYTETIDVPVVGGNSALAVGILEPATGTGQIFFPRTAGNPDTVTALLDGVATSITVPYNRDVYEETSAGFHVLFSTYRTSWQDYRHSVMHIVDVPTNGVTAPIQYGLENKTTGTSSIRFYSTPLGATVYDDEGTNYGITPFVAEGELVSKRYWMIRPEHDKAAVNAGGTSSSGYNVFRTLSPLADTQDLVFMLSDPALGRVSSAFDEAGITFVSPPTAGAYGVDDVFLRFYKSGYTEEIYKLPFDRRDVEFIYIQNMTPLEPGMGAIYVYSNPTGAHIYLNGSNTSVGRTPKTLYLPADVPVPMELRAWGYANFTRSITAKTTNPRLYPIPTLTPLS